jgi:hypothetical protein
LSDRTTLLREIQSGATDPGVDISNLLRRAKILAARLSNPDFQAWVDQELNGFAERAELPLYRILPAIAYASINDGYRQWNTAPVMTSFLPDKLKDWGERVYLKQPIAALASLVGGKKLDGELHLPWPQEMAVTYGAKGYNGFECLRAWQSISPDLVIGIIDTVRNRILDFVLKIEAEYPEAGEAQPGTKPIPEDKLQPLVHNVFYGPVGSVAQNSERFSQTTNTFIDQSDLARLVVDLKKHLPELNLGTQPRQRAEAQIAVLEAELVGEQDQTIIRQVGQSLRSITEGAIGSLLAAAVQPSLWQWIHATLSRL